MPRLVSTRRGMLAGGAALTIASALGRRASAQTQGAQVAAPPEAQPAAPESIATLLDPALRMTAEVFVNGQGPYRFLVDTGADHSAISADLAASLGLASGPQTVVHGVAGAVTAPSAIAATLDVGSRRLQGLLMPLLQRTNMGAAGVLGIDTVQDQQVEFDFPRQRILIQASPPRHAAWDEIVVKARSRFGQLVLVDASVDDWPVLVVIDTGAESTIGNAAFRRRLHIPKRDGVAERTDIFSVTGQTTTGDWATAPAVRVGGFTLQHLPVVFSELHSFDRWRLQEQPALLLGMDALRKFDRVQIDFARRQVRFSGAHAMAPPLDRTTARFASVEQSGVFRRS